MLLVVGVCKGVVEINEVCVGVQVGVVEALTLVEVCGVGVVCVYFMLGAIVVVLLNDNLFLK